MALEANVLDQQRLQYLHVAPEVVGGKVQDVVGSGHLPEQIPDEVVGAVLGQTVVEEVERAGQQCLDSINILQGHGNILLNEGVKERANLEDPTQEEVDLQVSCFKLQSPGADIADELLEVYASLVSIQHMH